MTLRIKIANGNMGSGLSCSSNSVIINNSISSLMIILFNIALGVFIALMLLWIALQLYGY